MKAGGVGWSAIDPIANKGLTPERLAIDTFLGSHPQEGGVLKLAVREPIGRAPAGHMTAEPLQCQALGPGSGVRVPRVARPWPPSMVAMHPLPSPRGWGGERSLGHDAFQMKLNPFDNFYFS